MLGRKFRMKRLSFYCQLLFVAATVDAGTWHVSPQSLPSLTADQQFRTIHEAAATASAGDIVLIHSGLYREAVVIEKVCFG